MLGVFTYNIPHRKTYDTLCLLKAKGYKEVVVFAHPLHYKKKFKPIYEHRPKSINDIYPQNLCDNLGYLYEVQDEIENILPSGSKILICGAGVLLQEVVQKYRIINSHPGYLPNSRGLDALKWAIYEGQPIGVTTHRVGHEVDAGLMIDRVIVPIYYNDTFHAVAQRQYEIEIQMLVNALERVDSATGYCDSDSYEAKMRMPAQLESNLLEIFEEYKQKHAVVDDC